MSDNIRRFSMFPKTLDKLVEQLTRPMFKTQGLGGSRIVSQWQSIVGKELAQHTLPEKLSFPKGKQTGGTLVISTENGFATELQHRIPQIIERLSTYLGYQAVSRIVISHSWVPAPEIADVPPPIPTLKHAAKDLTDGITDPDLKKALESLGQALSGTN